MDVPESKPSPLARLVRSALAQHGVISARQFKAIDVDRRVASRALAAGKLDRVYPSVYRVVGSQVTWESELMAAHLWLGQDSVVSHLSAAGLWRLPGFPRGPIELSINHRRKSLPPVVVRQVVYDLGADTTTVAKVPVTNAGRTLVDIAGSVTEDQLEQAVEDALRRKLASIRHIKWVMNGRSGKGAKGCRVLKRLIDDLSVTRPTESVFETKLLQSLRKAGLPPPVRQFQIFDGNRFVARVDFSYPWAKVAIEADSYSFHSGRQAWEADIDRRAAITALGWLVINVTFRQMKSDLDAVVDRVRAALTPALKVP